MDPVTAFSLACGVIQVVDFSTKVVVKCRELYKDGASSENTEIESMAKDLKDLFTDLDSASAIPNPGPMPRLYHDDQDLRKLAQQCSETARELITQLQKLKIQGPPRKRDVLPKTFKVFWKKSAIEDIETRLEQYRRTLDTRILINLRQHVHLISIEQSDGFRDLDRKLQSLIIGVSRDQNTFDELKDLIQAENASSKQHVSQEFEKHRELIAAQDSYKRLIDSLYFPDILSRQEGIEQAHKQTFEWIFDKAGNQVRPWHHFVDWLEKGHGTYWISGKAGAGKSTLMSFICQDSRTEVALRVWSGINEVFIPNFFFWNPGTQLQKSLVGLLRSLIYQLVERFPDLTPVIISSMGPTQHRLRQLPTWTEHRLRETLQRLLSYGLKAYSLCIFIDGLDEFSGDHTVLLDLIRNLKQSTRVKFCLSSRPYQSFEDEFGSSAMLKLQDLTEPDIRRYVSDKLDQAPLRASQVAYPSTKLKDMVDTIVRKAEGVFLWVNLAVRDQLEGIRNGDDTEQLQERLKLLPEEIEELYGHMLQKIDKVYRKEVAHYLQLVLLNDGRLSLFDIALPVHKRIDDIILFSPDIAISDILNHCRFTKTRIATTCKGLLEVQEIMDFHEWQKSVNDPSPKTYFAMRIFSESLEEQNAPLEQREDLIETKFHQKCTWVDFLHRTAVDFLKDNEQGKSFLETNAPRNPHPKNSYVKAELAGLVVFPVPTEFDQVAVTIRVRVTIERIMYGAYEAEAETGVAQVALMDLLDRSLAMLCQRSTGQPSDLHWCRAWDFPESFTFSPLKLQIQGTSEPNNGGILAPWPPVDFLGFAAWSGLHKYVEHTLGSQSGRQNSSISDYLLSCAVDGFKDTNERSTMKGYMELISALLQRGANPNMKSLKSTIWGSFLQKSYQLCYRGLFVGWGDVEAGLLGTVVEFLGSGANVNEKIYWILDNELPENIDHSASSIPFGLVSYRIGLQISALSVLQQCFAGAPNFAEIEKACIDSGAFPYFECSAISFSVCDGQDPDMIHDLDLNLSKQQLIQFSQALDQRLRACRGDPDERLPMTERQLKGLFQKSDIEQLWKQACREDDEDNDGDESYPDEGSTTSSDSTTPETEGPSHSAPTSQTETLPLRTKRDD